MCERSVRLLLAHFAVPRLMHDAAPRAAEQPDRLSFLHALHVVRRKLPLFAALPPWARRTLHEAALAEILEERVAGGCGRGVPGSVKREISGYKLRPHAPQPTSGSSSPPPFES